MSSTEGAGGAWVRKPAGSYVMTDVRCPGGRPREQPNASAGMRVGPPRARMRDRIRGKKVVERSKRIQPIDEGSCFALFAKPPHRPCIRKDIEVKRVIR